MQLPDLFKFNLINFDKNLFGYVPISEVDDKDYSWLVFLPPIDDLERKMFDLSKKIENTFDLSTTNSEHFKYKDGVWRLTRKQEQYYSVMYINCDNIKSGNVLYSINKNGLIDFPVIEPQNDDYITRYMTKLKQLKPKSYELIQNCSSNILTVKNMSTKIKEGDLELFVKDNHEKIKFICLSPIGLFTMILTNFKWQLDDDKQDPEAIVMNVVNVTNSSKGPVSHSLSSGSTESITWSNSLSFDLRFSFGAEFEAGTLVAKAKTSFNIELGFSYSHEWGGSQEYSTDDTTSIEVGPGESTTISIRRDYYNSVKVKTVETYQIQLKNAEEQYVDQLLKQLGFIKNAHLNYSKHGIIMADYFTKSQVVVV